MCGDEHVGPRGEIGMPRVHCLPRDKHDSVLGAVKRHSKGDAGADGGFDGSGIAFGRSALIREVPDVRAGTEAESWHARGGIGPHPQSNCTKRGHVAPSLYNWRNRLRFAEPAGCAGPIASAAVRVCCCAFLTSSPRRRGSVQASRYRSVAGLDRSGPAPGRRNLAGNEKISTKCAPCATKHEI